MKKIVMIAAVSQDGVIGVNGTIPWKHKADMLRFKSLTTGNTVIMGRKTFESIGRALPNRMNIVLSRALLQTYIPTVYQCRTLEDAVSQADGTAFLIGGAEIYRLGMAMADEIDLTIVPETIGSVPDRSTEFGPVYFPWINPTLFKIVKDLKDPDSQLRHLTYNRAE